MHPGFLVFLIIMITIVGVVMTNAAMFEFKQTPALSVWRAIITIGILIVSVLVMCLVTPPEQEVWDKQQRELRNSAINDAIRNGKLNEQRIELYGKLPI
jgi:hypothetical protein